MGYKEGCKIYQVQGSKTVSASERELLKAFGKATRTAQEGDPLGLEAIRDLTALRPVAEALVARGWLRPSGMPGAYTLTEDGRMTLAGPLDVTLYTRPGCHLCEETKTQIAPLLRSAGARLREVNIDADEVLRQRYNLDVPVIFLGARKVAKHRVDLRQFQRQLAEAGRSASADHASADTA